MPSIALRTIQSESIEIISKPHCYKLKYTSPHLTLLSIYLYSPNIQWEKDGSLIKLVVNDPDTIRSLKDIDTLCLTQIQNYRPILKESHNQYYLWFSPNPEVVTIYNSQPSHVYLYLKTIQKKTNLNIPVLYILNYE